MNIIWTSTAWKQYNSLQTEDKKLIKKINDLIKISKETDY